MKRLSILATIAIVTALSGCCGGIRNFLTSSHGNACSTCDTCNASDTYGDTYTQGAYQPTMSPMYETILPGPTLPAELPGPVERHAT